MTEKRTLPKFANEAEEARWWEEHADELMDDFEQAAAEGRLGRDTVARRMGIPTNLFTLDPADFKLAQEQAAKRGVQYYTYLSHLVHDALEREEKAS